MYFCYFIFISPWKRLSPFIWTNLNPNHPRMLCASLYEIGQMVLEMKIFFLVFVNVFELFLNHLPLGIEGAFIWIPFTQGCIMPSLAEIVPLVQENILKIVLMYFHYFLIMGDQCASFCATVYLVWPFCTVNASCT